MSNHGRRYVLVPFPVSRGWISQHELWEGFDRVVAKYLTQDN